MSVAFDSDVNITVEIGFDSDPLDLNQSFTDISQYVRRINIKRGRSNELAEFVSGSCTLLLSNLDNRFNPSQTTHYYDNTLGRTKIQPSKVVRISASYSGTTYRLYYGFLTDIPVSYPAEGADSVVTFKASDFFKTMNLETFETKSWQVGISGFSNSGQTTRASYVDAQELSSVRAKRILRQAGLDEATQMTVTTGSYQVQQQAISSNILTAIRDVEKAEGGEFFISGDGKGVFRDRTYPYTNTSATTVQATFSNTGTDLPYTNVVTTFDDKEIFNVYQWTRSGGSKQEIADAESISRFSVRLNSDTTINTSDGVVLSLIQERLANTATPILRIEQLKVNPRQDTSLWQHVLGRELGDRIKVKVQNPDSSVVEDELFLESINHTIDSSSQSWSWNVTMSPAGSSAWILGQATLGIGTKFVY